MSTRSSSMINMVVTLALVTGVAAFSLGFVFELTEEPIALAKIEKQKRALNAVLSEYDNDPLSEAYSVAGLAGNDSLVFYPAMREGTRVGMAVKSYSTKGYSGLIILMVGFDRDGVIQNVEVLEHKETPGLGSKMSTPKFKDQYLSQNPGSFDIRVKKDGGQIDAISGATISSRAFSEAIQLAYDKLNEQPK